MITYLLPILSVLVGFLFVIIFKPQQKKNLKLLLAFSGAFLLGITIFEMLPEIFQQHNNTKTISLFIVFGILFQICLEFFSEGAEHGHVHLHEEDNKFPWMLFISLSLHSLIEGTPLGHHDNILYGIVIHKIPVVIILATFFMQSAMKKSAIALFLTLFALMTPLGTFLISEFPSLSSYSSHIMAMAVGIFLHISTTILFESSEGHKFNLVKLIIITVGLISAYFI
ncbi:MAG: ZIP family metal transporter [Flavobacteriaceae bacterium]|nr:ZIP family metal transporter [Flavobacteriaceae bacterium]PHS06902.1 MAG: ZIP family metal transporter [Kordia sp.]